MIMNSLKRFLIVSIVLATGISTAMACGHWGRLHYSVFSAYQRNQMGYTFTPRMQQFWFDYSPEIKERAYDISGLRYVSNEDFDESENALIKAARDKGDKEMLAYLRLLCKYTRISSDLQNEGWNYPTKEDLAQREKDLKYMNFEARSYGGTRLAGQYCLMVMRTNMVLGNHTANLAYWNNHKDKLKASVYKDMMKDIYAGALYNMGKLDEASDIYYELGDMNSLMWINRDNINLDGLKKEYARNPSSPALIYILQELTNTLSDSHYFLVKHHDDDDTDAIAQNAKEVNALIAFASQVLKENKTQLPAMWQSAMGWLNHALGNDKEAVSQLDKAMKMKGTERMIDNARVCRLVATACSEKPSKKTFAFLKQEMEWMTEMEKKEPADAWNDYEIGAQNHYTEVLQNLIYDDLAPAYTKQGYAPLAAALVKWMDNHADVVYEYWDYIDNMTAKQMIDYYAYINTKPATDFEAWILSAEQDMSADKFNDMVGTKLIREGRFAEAIPYLEKVSLAYLGQQGIAPYASVRDYHVEMCFKRQYNDAGFEGGYTITSNQKLDFCKEFITIKKQVDELPAGAEKAEAAYTLANMLLQASYRGNCWYISRYSNSVYDSMRYEGEMDFLAQAANYYDVAVNQPGIKLAMKQCYIYAAAFLPYGESFYTTEYDEEYNAIHKLNKDTYQYRALNALKLFADANPRSLAGYVTNCDVLRQFRSFK